MRAFARGGALAVFLLASQAALAATAEREPFGASDNGEQVDIITLRNAHGMSVRFLTRGGAITQINVPDGQGRIGNVVLGLPDFAAWDRSEAFNGVVGRYANRISGGGFTLDGTFHALPGADPRTGVVIHSYPHGFGSRLWKAELFERKGQAGAILRYVSADGENGFPGELRVTMTYTLDEADRLRIDYEATTSKSTVVNLTNHSYFNLGGAGSGPVYDQWLQVLASRWTPTDDAQVPTGEIASVEGTPFDFRKPVRIGERVYSTHPQMLLAHGLDHNFILDKPKGVAMPVAVRLTDPGSCRRMEVRTTEPAIQIYSSNFFDGSTLGADGRTLRQGDGLALETQHSPDSPNKPQFPSTVLRPGEVFQSSTEYAFSVEKPCAKRKAAPG
ncbi:MAG: aldose epimerase family protein [Sphingobium sp.]